MLQYKPLCEPVTNKWTTLTYKWAQNAVSYLAYKSTPNDDALLASCQQISNLLSFQQIHGTTSSNFLYSPLWEQIKIMVLYFLISSCAAETFQTTDYQIRFFHPQSDKAQSNFLTLNKELELLTLKTTTEHVSLTFYNGHGQSIIDIIFILQAYEYNDKYN